MAPTFAVNQFYVRSRRPLPIPRPVPALAEGQGTHADATKLVAVVDPAHVFAPRHLAGIEREIGTADAVMLAVQLPDDQLLGEFWYNSDHAAKQGDTDPAKHNQQSADPAGPAAALNSTNETAISDPKTAEGNKYANCEFEDVQHCDLLAQQSMADSTESMKQAAWAGVILTVLGLILIYRTMSYTRHAAKYAKRAARASENAVKEARRATAAANRTTKVTEAIGHRQVRAYVTASGGRWERDRSSGAFKAVIQIKNAGHSPAFKVRAWCIGIVAEPGEIIDWNDRSSGFWRKFFLGPTDTGHIIATGVIDDSDYSTLKKEIAIFFFYGSIFYRDTFDVQRETHFRLQWTGVPDSFPASLEVCEEGNDAT